MAGKEADRLSPEQQQAYRRLAGFFGGAESEFPAAAWQLVSVVGRLVGENRTTREELQNGMGNIDVGLALIGDWLREVGADGFEVKLGFGGGAKKAIGRSQVKFPTVSDLIRVSGRVDVDLQKQIPPLLSLFSRQIRSGLDVGLSPRQIVGGLVAESVGSRLSANGSAVLREALNKPLGGHFEWIRDALGIPDVAGQPGFTEKTTQPVGKERRADQAKAKPAEEVSPAEREFQREKARIRRYLTEEGGMDFLKGTGDESKWEHVGEDGSVKQVFRPLTGALRNEKVCLRRNVLEEGFSPTKSALKLQAETRFLKQVKNQHFVKVYAHALLEAADREGIGEYDPSKYWEVVDFVEGEIVERYGGFTPATRLKVILAACECESEAMSLDPPAWLSDVRPDAFKIQSDGQVKMIDVQVQSDRQTIGVAKELVMLCLELFPGKYDAGLLQRAIDGYFNPDRYAQMKGMALPGEQFPSLEEVFRGSDLPDEAQKELRGFLFQIKHSELEFNEVPVNLARRILPIAQRVVEEEKLNQAEDNVRSRIDQLGGRDLHPMAAGVIVDSLLTSLSRLLEERRMKIAGDCYPNYKVPLAQLYSYILYSAISGRANLTDNEISFPARRHPGEVAYDRMKSILGYCSRPGFELEYDDEGLRLIFSQLIEALSRMTPAERDLLAEPTRSKNINQLYADLVATMVGTRE